MLPASHTVGPRSRIAIGMAGISVFGAFRLTAPDGQDATPPGKRAKALLAMLALAPGGRRTRGWLQDRLWSDRDPAKGRASLRQELSALRHHLVRYGLEIISTPGDDVVLHLEALRVDAFVSVPAPHLDLLEGMDLPDPEFETWLSEERAHWYGKLDGHAVLTAPPQAVPQGPEPPQLAARTLFPHLAIEPFAVIGGDAQLSYLASGLREELSTVIGAVVGTYRIIDPSLAGEDVDYLLQGSLRMEGEHIRLNARIVAAHGGSIVWNDRFDLRALSFGAQERLSRRIVEAIQTALSDGRWAEYWAGSETDIRAWELFQKGRVQENSVSRTALARAMEFYRQAIAIDPSFLQARVSLGFCLLDGLRLGWHDNPRDAEEGVARIVAEIFVLSPSHLHGRALHAFWLCSQGHFEDALARMTAVVAESPESPEMLSYLAAIFGYCGDLAHSIDLYRHALTLTPHPPVWIRTNLILDCLMLGRNGVGPQIDEVLEGDPGNIRAHICKTVHLIRADRMGEARQVAERIRSLQPGFTAANWRSRAFFRDPSNHDTIAADLARAGL